MFLEVLEIDKGGKIIDIVIARHFIGIVTEDHQPTCSQYAHVDGEVSDRANDGLTLMMVRYAYRDDC